MMFLTFATSVFTLRGRLSVRGDRGPRNTPRVGLRIGPFLQTLIVISISNSRLEVFSHEAMLGLSRCASQALDVSPR